jgi:hypothetical protein
VRRLVHIVLVVIAALAIALFSPTAGAEEGRFRLAYEAPDATCPTRARMRALIVARLGVDPFTDDIPTLPPYATLRIEISASGSNGYAARIARLEDAVAVGERELGGVASCAELGAATAFAASMLVDPNGSLAKRMSARTEPPPTPSPREDPFETRPVAPAAPSPVPSIQLASGAHVLVGAGLAPAPAFGLGIDVVASRERLSLALEVRADLPVSAEPLPDGAGVRTHLLVGSLSPCVRIVGLLGACGVLAFGAVFASSENLSPPARDATWFGGIGVRPTLLVPLADRVALTFAAEALIPFRRIGVSVKEREVWMSSPVTGSVAAGVRVSFF